MATNTKTNYNLHLKGFVGGYDFDADYVDYINYNTNTNEKDFHFYLCHLGLRASAEQRWQNHNGGCSTGKHRIIV